MKQLRNILILLAGALLVLHTLLPHDHHTELSDAEHAQQHESTNDILDYLLLAFHLDLGENHLEDFNLPTVEKVVFPDLLMPYVAFSFEAPIMEKATAIVVVEDERVCTRLFSSQLRFRGPPTIQS